MKHEQLADVIRQGPPFQIRKIGADKWESLRNTRFYLLLDDDFEVRSIASEYRTYDWTQDASILRVWTSGSWSYVTSSEKLPDAPRQTYAEYRTVTKGRKEFEEWAAGTRIRYIGIAVTREWITFKKWGPDDRFFAEEKEESFKPYGHGFEEHAFRKWERESEVEREPSNNLFIGVGTGSECTCGKNNILVGDGLQLPCPETCGYVNIGGVVIACDEETRSSLRAILGDIR